MNLKKLFVRDLATGDAVDEVFAVSEARSGQARNGPFWSLVLSDNSGQVPAKIFHPHSAACPAATPGMLVRVRGRVGEYRDAAQIVAETLEVLDPASPGLNLADFVAASQRPAEDLLAEIETLCRERLQHKPWLRLVRKVLADPEIRARLLAAPGAVNVHHAYVGGLLEHTLAVCRLCMGFCDLYPDLDREALLAAAVFHDLGKAWEYSAGLAREVTDQGRLLGHISLGLEVLEPFLARSGLEPGLILHLRHIILAHHGELAFGSPKRPKTAEAFALHFADNLDAKLATVAGVLDEAGAGEEGWSAYQRSLERPVFRPRRTPGREAANQSPKGEQCSLPLKA